MFNVLNLEEIDPDLKGFVGGFVSGTFGYIVPYGGDGVALGKVVRVALDSASTANRTRNLHSPQPSPHAC